MTELLEGVPVVERDELLEEFLASWTARDPRAVAGAADLYDTWNGYRIVAGRPVESTRAAGMRFRARFAQDQGVVYARTNGGTVYRGLRVLTEPTLPIEEAQ